MLIVSVVIVSYRGQSLVTVVLLLGVLFSAPVARFTRTATRAITQSDYVVVAKSLGAPTKRILWTELRPNITRPMFAFFALLSGAGVLAEGGLSFIGLGVPLENASWGRLIAGGRPELATAWWWAMCPAAVFFLTSLGLNVLADHFGGVQPLRKKRSERWSSQKGGHRSTSRVSADASINPCAAGYSVLQSFNSAAAPGPRTGTAPALLVRDLTVSVPTPNGTIELVSGANLFVNPGEIVAIVGTSGAGKTSLVQAICGATSGRYIHGLVLAPSGVERVLTPARPGRDTALVMQEPRRSLDAVTHVGWQIAEPARVHFGLSRRAARARAIELLVAVGMDDPQHRFFSYPHQLSGGQCQRIAIALALACDPSVLIADEPTGSLDPIARRQILDLLDRLRSERNLAVLLVTHDRAIASDRADRVITMEHGLITAVS